ncbi:MAG: flagellar hook-basal body complex protein [Thermoguttaceae bacterium]
MGLASALSTALTGLSAAETTIDVVGNNLANANTVGFKASQAQFATQFLQTLSLGSAPTDNAGGTNPRQTGLGTVVAEIAPNFSQGTIEISSNPTDMAIQGDGFFIVQGPGGEHLYTRNGVFKMNAANEMITLTGNRVLGYGVNDQFEIQRTVLVPITIPLGSAAVAQATTTVFLEGQLSPTGDIATQAARIRTDVLSNGYYTAPSANPEAASSAAPNVGGAGTWGSSQPGGGMTPGATYEYRLVYANEAYSPGPPPTIPPLSESTPSEVVTAAVAAGNGSILLQNIPDDPTPASVYSYVRIYRRNTAGPAEYSFIDEIPVGTATYLDTTSDAAAATQPVLDETRITGKYRYYVTFATAAGGPGVGTESRVNLDLSPSTVNVVNGRVVLYDLPTADPAEGWLVRRIYRCLATNDSEFHYLGEIPDVTSSVTLTDNTSDAVLAAQPEINLDGPKILPGTLLTDVLRREGTSFNQVFREGTLHFTGEKGGRTLATKDFQITATSTVQDLIDFMTQALGIQPTTADPLIPIPQSETDVPGVYAAPGGTVDTQGRIVLTGNNGVDNAISVDLSGMTLTYTASGQTYTETVNLPFSQFQSALGESAVTDTLVYDSLGIPLGLRITAVLESRNSTATTYRWFADSPDNSLDSPNVSIAVGTGTISFDSQGNFKQATQSTVNIYRTGYPSVNPLAFDLDFSQITGLATEDSSLAVSRQDGFAPGVLTSFIVGEDGRISGVFSNGATRDLGQIRLVRFANPNGLEQRGQNLYATGVNSGLPVQGDPGSQGIGTVIAGALELSNTDIGGNLIDLILASTMYRGNTRVITTVQQMLDELLALRR